MIKEFLYGESATIKWFGRHFPDEIFVFACPATYSQFKQQSRKGRSRRGIVIFTKDKIIFKSVLFSMFSLIYVIGCLLGLLAFIMTRNILHLVLSLLVGGMISQRWPMQRQVEISEIDSVNLSDVRAITLLGYKEIQMLKVEVQEEIITLHFNNRLPVGVERILGIINDYVD